ncbi:HNH endonuclease [Amycolatopsis sp. cg9]|uniref:HNH endonuclease n=1 Tax=Amycolatopsis sp. cg9 TaxID=3238801 RepID=UPI003525059D
MDTEAVWQADAEALADRLRGLLTVVRSAESEIGALLVEIESRGVMELFGYRSTARLLDRLADIPHAAQCTVTRARALNPSHTLDAGPALAPATGVAARDGPLSTPMIDTALTHIPLEHRDCAERDLLAFAADVGHTQVAVLGARILAHLDPDAPHEPRPNPPPRPANCPCAANALGCGSCRAALDSSELPAQAGERAHVMVAVSLKDLRSGLGRATLGDTGLISAVDGRIHACDCKLIPAVLGSGSGGGPTDLVNLVLVCGHHYRLLPRSRRRKPRRNNLHRPLPFAA